jgi:hypothetical protein
LAHVLPVRGPVCDPSPESRSPERLDNEDGGAHEQSGSCS